ncbi:hypothetical protein [Candidatus Uabimicrobium sp. HlEnr_7]|uniref:hypothetical protein n=1 Tax=Candidatus Uabimicrobium helgolandensis TaxID=3095367 RepID=UPI0035588862
MTNVIALDIGRVCINLNYDDCAQLLGFSHIDDFFACKEIWAKNILMETGKISANEFASQIQKVLPEKSQQQIINAWQAIIGKEIYGIREIVKLLATKNKIVFLSNTSQIHFTQIRNMLSFSSAIDQAVLSFEVGCMKPNLQIYQEFERQFGRPQLFIDDKEENILSAQQIHWPCYHMGNTEELRKIVDQLI